MFRKSMKHAIAGILITIKSERNFRFHLLFLSLTIFAGFFFHLTTEDWLFIIAMSTMVLFSELINTAVEKTLDWLEPNHHDIVKIVKDMCAGAVLVSAIGAALVGVIIFLPHVLALLKQI